jgi:2-octaprenylphenol hydroxylase
MSIERYDIVVTGAGLVGASAALSLARKGFRVVVIESSTIEFAETDSKGPFDLRVLAISPQSQKTLEQLDVWQSLDPNRLCFYEQMHIWHEHGNANLAFDCVGLARDKLGVIVENRLLQQALHRACHLHGVEWSMPDQIAEIKQNDDQGLHLQLKSGRSIKADLLIAADGRNSPTRTMAGIESHHGEYGQMAIVANVSTEIGHQHTAWQRFLATGPLAFLPLGNGQSSIVWSCDNALARQHMEADNNAFCQALAEAFEYKLGNVLESSQRLTFPLGWHSCEHWLENRVVLIGDAAHSVHPLAGQGVNLGFGDVELLSSLMTGVSSAWNRKLLRRYERQRKSETWIATKSFSGLKWLFAQEQKSLIGVRDLGMQFIEKNAWCKRSLMQAAINNFS